MVASFGISTTFTVKFEAVFVLTARIQVLLKNGTRDF